MSSTLCSHKMSFPGDSDSKESACNAEYLYSIPGLGRAPGEGNGNSLQVFFPRESHGQRSLAGYNPWGHKESDMTETKHISHEVIGLDAIVLTS